MKFTTLFYAAAVVTLVAQVIPNVAWAQAQPTPPLSGVHGKDSVF
jgi:hypothetical protein